MSTVDGSDHRSFWSNKHVNIFEGAPFRLNNFMTRNRFEKILNNITYTNHEPPAFRDRFWEIRQMVDEWNANMDINFSPSWKNCLDESMSKWLNEYTCPGFIFVHRKPWPFGNGWHDIGCAVTNVIWQLEIREGKDQPRKLPKEHDNKGITVGTLLRLTKPIHGSGKLVVLDSGFCVLQGLVELKRLGVFAHALIKKRRYWPKHVKGDDIIQHFANKEVGSADALQGQLDGVPVYIYGMKDPDYTMMLMATYGTLAEQGDKKTRNFMDGGSKVVKKFKYPKVVYNHYQFRDVIDNNNSMRMSPISMEETWMTSRWANRVFCFLLAVTVVNIQNAGCYFLNLMKVDALKACKLITEQLIHNKYLRKPEEKRMHCHHTKNSNSQKRCLTTQNTTVGSACVVTPV